MSKSNLVGITTVILLFGAVASFAASDAALSPAGIEKRIAASGARKTLSMIFENEQEWQQLLNGVETGRRRWIEVAIRLHEVSDAGSSVQLNLAVGNALEHRPANVLRLAIPAFTLESVCGQSDVDDPRYDSYKLSLLAIERRKAAVSRAG